MPELKGITNRFSIIGIDIGIELNGKSDWVKSEIGIFDIEAKELYMDG